MTLESQLPIELAQLTAMLSALSQQVVDSRSVGRDPVDDNSQEWDARPLLQQAAPLLAALHAHNRRTLATGAECREQTTKARKEMDERYLALQNLLFEKQHLEDEIRRCEEYESQYQNVPLEPIESLRQMSLDDPTPKGLIVPLPQDEHELMLARLEFELAERQRYDQEKKELGAEKAKLIKDNEVSKNELVDLERKLDDFVEAAKAIQADMHQGDPQDKIEDVPAQEQHQSVESSAMVVE